MRLSTGTIATLVLAVGALLILVTAEVSSSSQPKTSYLRTAASRKLYNYSKSSSSSSQYDGSSGYMNPNYSNGDGTYGGTYSDESDGSYNGSYNGSYENGNNAQNYQNQDYEGAYANDDNAYYNSNKAYQSWNGRDQGYAGQTIQMYDDDAAPVVYTDYEQDGRFGKFTKYSGLSGAEVFLLLALMTMAGIFVAFAFCLSSGYNVIDLYHLYCRGAIFGHKDVTEDEDIGDDFEKLEE